MVGAISRAGFLRGRFKSPRDAIRPPWAINEAEFTNRCTAGMSCADACPENIIIKGQDGLPEISFKDSECTFCEFCVKVCPVDALVLAKNALPWQLHLTVSDVCLSSKEVICRVCPEKCDARAISFRTPGILEKPTINQDSCTGCGACIATCPVGALSLSPVQQYKVA